MNLKVLLPTQILVDEADVRRVSAEADDGSFSLLPGHVDLTAPLVPGLLGYTTSSGQDRYAAVAEGVLVKCGDDVMVSVRRAVVSERIEELQRHIEEEFRAMDEREETARTALNKIEATLMHRLIEYGEE
jgi:F-type H+-transporting ATPase subunit epsilon